MILIYRIKDLKKLVHIVGSSIVFGTKLYIYHFLEHKTSVKKVTVFPLLPPGYKAVLKPCCSFFLNCVKSLHCCYTGIQGLMEHARW